MVGQHYLCAIAGRGVALGRRRVDGHDDRHRNAKRLAGGGEPLREISRRVGDDACLASSVESCFSRQ
jgi:hypothetical protein